MNEFALGETEAAVGDRRLLVGEAADIDFDASLALAVESEVFEQIEVEIAVEFAIDALEQVEVEGRGHPGPIIVGRFENPDILFKVDTDQHLAAGPENISAVLQEPGGGSGLKLPIVEPGKNPTRLPAGPGKDGRENGPV